MSELLVGTVERITYYNPENGYTVAQVTPDGRSYSVAVVGNLLEVSPGESLRLHGQWINHPRYGRQFQIERYSTLLPATATGIEKYLGSGLIKGIGPVTARRIVRRFKLDTLRIIEQDPQRLREVLGVGKKRVSVITRAWEEQKAIKEVMIFLQSHNVSTAHAVRIFKTYGDDSIATVRSDPYRLARDIHGIGFLTADKIARELGLSHDSPQRVQAGITYTLSQMADDGHVYALDASTGDPVEGFQFQAENWIWSKVTVGDDQLWVTSLDGKLYALDPNNGEQVAPYPYDSGEAGAEKDRIRTDPLRSGDKVIVAAASGRIIAVQDAARRWVWPGGAPENEILTTPVLSEGTLYVVSTAGNVQALDAEDGTQRWSYSPSEDD